ncbi:MAG: BON domain-containing protein [Thalassobaculaceae bacterium]|nr:BON domain-containing protein [Thalassobaculaceae bacterium]
MPQESQTLRPCSLRPYSPRQTRSRSRHLPWLAVAVAAVLALPLAGCSPAGVAVGAGAAGVTAAQTEKGFTRSVDDGRIRLQLNAKFFETNYDLFSEVSFTVDEGRVLLTGAVRNPDDRVTATRLAWSADGVFEVINELQVTDQSTLTDFGRDTRIATELRVTLLTDDKVASINFSVEVVNQTVYIMGIARTQAELARVIGHARNVPYVRGVVDYVRVNS